jgi:c-di-GMP-binding flagellar brake protein YcgR
MKLTAVQVMGEEEMGAEQRKSQRISCLVPVDGKAGSTFDETQTVDFSKGGIGLISTHAIPVNKQMPMEIDLGENEDPVFVIAKVKWVKKIKGTDTYRVGMIFTEVLQGSKSRLKSYFEKTRLN